MKYMFLVWLGLALIQFFVGDLAGFWSCLTIGWIALAIGNIHTAKEEILDALPREF